MNVNNRIATLDAIFQELKATHPTPAYLSKRKYKLSDAEREHIEAMLTETGLVEVIEEPYALTKFRLNNKGLIELKKHGSYSDFLKERASPATQMQSNMNEIIPPQKSILEIISWVVGIAAGLIALYEFVIKKLVK